MCLLTLFVFAALLCGVSGPPQQLLIDTLDPTSPVGPSTPIPNGPSAVQPGLIPRAWYWFVVTYNQRPRWYWGVVEGDTLSHLLVYNTQEWLSVCALIGGYIARLVLSFVRPLLLNCFLPWWGACVRHIVRHMTDMAASPLITSAEVVFSVALVTVGMVGVVWVFRTVVALGRRVYWRLSVCWRATALRVYRRLYRRCRATRATALRVYRRLYRRCRATAPRVRLGHNPQFFTWVFRAYMCLHVVRLVVFVAMCLTTPSAPVSPTLVVSEGVSEVMLVALCASLVHEGVDVFIDQLPAPERPGNARPFLAEAGLYAVATFAVCWGLGEIIDMLMGGYR